jgi:GAF domain-containing protein
MPAAADPPTAVADLPHLLWIAVPMPPELPCGIVLDMDAPVLTAYSERGYDWIAACDVTLPEVLLVPLHIDSKEPSGTLWIVSDKDGHFHREHARAMTELASFVAIALRMLRTESKLHAALDEQVILTMEMSHRIKNLFAMTDGMIRFTEKSATTPKEMSALLSGRMHALANANALVRREFSEVGSSAPTSDLRELIERLPSLTRIFPLKASRVSPSRDRPFGAASEPLTPSPLSSTNWRRTPRNTVL